MQRLTELVQAEQLSKYNWASVRECDVNVDQGRVIFDDGTDTSSGAQVERIVEAAREGNWVLMCPIVFPQYMNKVHARLDTLRSAGEIHPEFRFLVDLQNLNVNQVPDSFLSSHSFIFHLSELNYD